MKKLFLALMLFLAFNVQNFAFTTIVNLDVAILETDNNSAVLLDGDLDEAPSVMEVQNLDKNDENTDQCCTNCSVITITCHCGASFRAQFCQGGCCPHPSLDRFVLDLCNQACKDFI